MLSGVPLGSPARACVDPADRRAVTRAIAAAEPNGTVRLPAFHIASEHGRAGPFTGFATNLLDDPDTRHLVIQLRPMTRRSDDHRAVLADLNRSLNALDDPAAVATAILRHASHVTAAASAAILSWQRNGTLAVTSTLPGTDAATHPVQAPSPSLVRCAAATDASYLHGRDASDAWARFTDHDVRSAAVIPMLVGARHVGALVVAFDRAHAFAPDDRETLTLIAEHCAPTLDRARIAAELEHERAWHELAARHSSDIVTVVDRSGVILYENGALEGVLGHAPHKLIGRHATDMMHPEDREAVQQRLASVAPNVEPKPVQYRYLHRDGHYVWLESLGSALPAEGGTYHVLVNSRDVSARVEAEIERRAAMLELTRSERNFRLLAENAHDLIRRFTPGRVAMYVSPAARTLLDLPAEALVSRGPSAAVLPEDVGVVHDAFGTLEHGRQDSVTFECRMRRHDGATIWTETHVRAIRNATGGLLELHASTRSIEERKRAELQVRRQLERYRKLVHFTAALEQLANAVDIVREALRWCLDLTEFDYGTAHEVQGDVTRVLHEAGLEHRDRARQALREVPVNLRAGIIDHVRAGRAWFANADEPIMSPPEPLPRTTCRAYCLFPVMRARELIGVLVFGTVEQCVISGETRALLEGLVDRLQHLLDRQLHVAQLNTSREETLRSLGLALEYRDYETKGHTDRVVTLTERLGRALGYQGANLDALRWGAYLHDTGKVAIPDAILLKPGKLDEREWAVIKRHPSIGHAMLEHIPSLPRLTLDVVLYHQERWNGSGYPEGRLREDTPLAARVFAVVDVYDALTSERPYKHAWSHEEALHELQREAGVLLDPSVVSAFVRLFGEPSLV